MVWKEDYFLPPASRKAHDFRQDAFFSWSSLPSPLAGKREHRGSEGSLYRSGCGRLQQLSQTPLRDENLPEQAGDPNSLQQF